MIKKQFRAATLIVASVAVAATLTTIPQTLVLNHRINKLEQQITDAIAATATPTPTAAPTQIVDFPTSTPAPTLAPTPEVTPEATPEPESNGIKLSAAEVDLIGRTIWGEAGGVKSKAERAAVAWCILNRVDAWGQSIEEVVLRPHQFQGYRSDEHWGECPKQFMDLAADVLTRWKLEKEGAEDVGRVLPAEYLYFLGDGQHNHFTTEFLGDNAWDWSLPDPYAK